MNLLLSLSSCPLYTSTSLKPLITKAKDMGTVFATYSIPYVKVVLAIANGLPLPIVLEKDFAI